MIEKSLHERIVEMFKAGKKKKVIARLLGVGIKTVRKLLGGQERVHYSREPENPPFTGRISPIISGLIDAINDNPLLLIQKSAPTVPTPRT